MKNIASACKNDFLLEHSLKEEVGKVIMVGWSTLPVPTATFSAVSSVCAKPRPPEAKLFSVGFSPSAADCPIPLFNWQFPQVLVDAYVFWYHSFLSWQQMHSVFFETFQNW